MLRRHALLQSRRASQAWLRPVSSTSAGPAEEAAVSSFEPPGQLCAPFSLSRAQARERFEAWCSGRRLGAGGLWDETDKAFRCDALLLPFWAFDVVADVRYRARLGYSRGGKVVEWKPCDWTQASGWSVPRGDPAAQTYASFDLRRDVVAAAKGAHAATAYQLSSPPASDVLLPPFQVRRALAWTLARRHVLESLRARAAASLRASSGASEISELQLEASFCRVVGVPVRLPAYVLHYSHGTTVKDDQSIVPERFVGCVGGASGAVAADELLSPRKAQLAASVPLLLLAAAAQASPALPSSAAPELAFLAALSAVLAGVAARRLPASRQEDAEGRRLKECDAAIARGAGATAATSWMDEQAQAARDGAEWRRWEETGLWRWDARKRAEWALSLQKSQLERLRGRRAWRREQQEAAAAEAEEARRTSARRAKWGDAPRRGQQGHDPQGYFRLLGLEERAGEATEEEIKTAFRREAHLLHPDKHGSRPGEQARAATAFRELQTAYAVLRDPVQRELYSRR